MNNTAKYIHIKGLVQGVGFRPFIYILAHRFGLKGWVENRNDGVIIHVEGSEGIIYEFLKTIRSESPRASNIFELNVKNTSFNDYKKFEIVKSENTSNEITEISPDIAVCEKCIEDLKTQKHRIDYPFINCTNCGPRFSIIKDLPYDREKTTMKPFEMCDVCHEEYSNIYDRRFHAQPVACNTCGPQYRLLINKETVENFNDLLSKTCQLLESGKIIAMKGMGGYHLACDASNEEVVKKLRIRKVREGKPFAVMFRDLKTLKTYAEVNSEEERLLTSWQAPITLLKIKKDLAPSVANGMHTLGVMLPYMPFHYLLFQKTDLAAIVLTSGNLSDEPIILDNDIAQKELGKISDAVLTYNRDIYNRTDDSVVFVSNQKQRLIRRSRGYAPSPVYLKLDVDGILATGAELVNCFALGKGNQAILSQHIGDLKNLETYEFYNETIAQFRKLFRMEPTLIARDLHPDYLSSQYAENQNIPKVQIQHHHAHIASAMAEHGLDEPVIGVAFDGTGLGDDGNIWGAEFFVCDLAGYQRVNHFEYIPMPGGDRVTLETWRMGVSYLYKTFGEAFLDFDLDFLQHIAPDKINLLLTAIDKNLNAPLSSSSGRLFDAVSAILNLCPVSKFHAEAPMRLESIIRKGIGERYSFEIGNVISFKNTFREIVNDIKNGTSSSVISAKFHNTVISSIFENAVRIQKEFRINKIVLSGGTFQNSYLLEQIENLLQKNKFEVYTQSKIPSNDGGIALGQLAIAAKYKELGKL